MHLSTLLLALCTFMVFSHGASSHLLPQAALHLVTNGPIAKEYKRQASDNEVLQCVSDGLDAAFKGNNSRFVSDCKSAGTQQLDLSTINLNDGSTLQPVVTSIYQFFCIRECGDILLEVYNDCGAFNGFPGGEKFSIDLCGTNQNGDLCYKLYGNGLDLIRTEASCYSAYTLVGTCSCQSELSAAITNQGCCSDAYHDLVESLRKNGFSTYNPGRLYSACNVNLPKECNNSPLTASGTLPLISAFTTVLCALMLTTLLG